MTILSTSSSVVTAQEQEQQQQQQQQCLSNTGLEDFFKSLNNVTVLPRTGSCCMKDVCNLPCPVEVDRPSIGFGISIAISIVIAFVVGVGSYFFIKGKVENFVVAGKTFPSWMVAITLSAAAIDSNVLLGNVDLSYKYSFWDGAVLPLGLALNLFINTFTLASKMNAEPHAYTVPDVIGNRFGKTVEVLCSLCCIASFLMLLAGNLVGMGVINSYAWDTSLATGIWVSAAVVWAYTVVGGLFSVATTDVVQGAIGWSGCLVCVFWAIANLPSAPLPSIGFPSYVYPNQDICDMYDGIPCTNDASKCCYNDAKWCPSDDNCRTDNGAYPIGDLPIYGGQMLDPYALTPFPNSIFWNWATLFILGFGNLAALDFQVRVMAAKAPRDAQIGCFVAGCITVLIGVPFAYFGAMARYYYGPDSIHAEFNVDTCSPILGLPTCGAWVPNKEAFLFLMANQVPAVLGAWCLIGIVAASMSTASGAILAMGTVFSHNMMRQFDSLYPNLITSDNLLFVTRLSTIPFTIISGLIASNSQRTGYLLIVAFDIVLASVVPSLVFGFYLQHKSSCAALCSVLTGMTMRIVLEFTLPKDGFLLLPFKGDEFLNYGSAASTGLPLFMDGPVGTVWDPAVEQCVQETYSDFTGVDSIASCFGAIIAYLIVYMIEVNILKLERPLFTFPGMDGYYKNIFMDEIISNDEKQIDSTKPVNYNNDDSSSNEMKEKTTTTPMEDNKNQEC